MSIDESIEELNDYVDLSEALTPNEKSLLLSFIDNLENCCKDLLLDD